MPPQRLGSLELQGAYELRSRDRDFGGISGILRQGDRLLLLSDRSHLFELGWTIHGAGQPFTMPVRRERELSTATGQPLDAEAMVPAPGDELLVADEETGRLFAFARGQSRPARQPVDLPGPFMTHRPTNEGVEALARLPDGSLVALSEGAWEPDGRHSLVRLGDDGAQLLQYQCPQGFQPTDADVAGDRLFVLERRISLLRGWQSRIVVVPLETLDDPAATVIEGQELALISGARLGENYEGLSVEPMPDGAFQAADRFRRQLTTSSSARSCWNSPGTPKSTSALHPRHGADVNVRDPTWAGISGGAPCVACLRPWS